MAAPFKMSLDYFPCDVGFAKDKKFRSLKKEYGAGNVILIYIALLDMIYGDKGYYLVYDEKGKQEVIETITDEYMLGKYCPTPETVAKVIDGLVACRCFDGDLYGRAILTSRRIQRVYYTSTVKRKTVNIEPDKWLLSVAEMKTLSLVSKILSFFINDGNNEVNDGINEVNDGINKQSKVKESKKKVNKSKVKESKVVVELPTLNGGVYSIDEDKLQQLQQRYKNIDVVLSLNKLSDYVQSNPDKRKNDYGYYITMWLDGDTEKIKNKQTYSLPKCQVSYDLEDYENSSMFDD